MNISRRTSLSLLFVALSTVPAQAALTGDSGADNTSIEASGYSDALQSIDQLLGGGNHPELFDSVLKQHNKSAQPSKTVMDGHYDQEGSSEARSSFGQLVSPQSTPAEAPDLAKAATVRLAGSGSPSDIASIAAMSSSSASPNSLQKTILTQDTSTGSATFITGTVDANPVPLPAAGLLLASGLVALPAMRRKRLQPV